MEAHKHVGLEELIARMQLLHTLHCQASMHTVYQLLAVMMMS